MPEISIIVPCRDEEENVTIITKNLQNNSNYKDFELIFINDFSKDRTEGILKELSNNFKNIYYFNNKEKGLGGAIKRGINKSSGNYITIMMADSADSVDDLNTYIDLIKNSNFDAIFGSRFIKGSKVKNYPKSKYLINRFANFVVGVFFLNSFNDYTNAFKIYKKDTLTKLQPIVSENFNVFLELPLKIIGRKYKYTVVPISWSGRKSGVSKFKINELGSKYLFTLLYCYLEKVLLKKRK